MFAIKELLACWSHCVNHWCHHYDRVPEVHCTAPERLPVVLCRDQFDGVYFLENVETKRYVFQDGSKVKGNQSSEGGWISKSPKVVGADANYYNRAYWRITPRGDGKYSIKNVETKRYLIQDGEPIKGRRGDEGGWLAHSGFKAPKCVGSDADYGDRALWYILPQSNGMYFIENVETHRYLFQDGKPIKGKRGAEGGWKSHSGFESPSVVGADANYYNRAYYRIVKKR